eukprot:scaffold3700_cov387-Prasinococcus_capsulatus_cf.AAC.8
MPLTDYGPKSAYNLPCRASTQLSLVSALHAAWPLAHPATQLWPAGRPLPAHILPGIPARKILVT